MDQLNDREREVFRHWLDSICSGDGIRRYLPPGFPKVVCLCGSTKFKQAFIEANFRETMSGNIVLSVGWFSHADAAVYSPSESEKAALDELHKRKIDVCDEVLVLNVENYIGESTRSEIEYAKRMRKPVRYLEAA